VSVNRLELVSQVFGVNSSDTGSWSRCSAACPDRCESVRDVEFHGRLPIKVDALSHVGAGNARPIGPPRSRS
jgi:hypothetical protein